MHSDASPDQQAAPSPGGSVRPRLVIVMPAYNAAMTLERTYADIPHDLVHKIILVDDVSQDETVEIADQLGLDVIIHSQNRGYGGNQKTCYDAALGAGADVVVMLHPDYQYDATRIPALIEPILQQLGIDPGQPSVMPVHKVIMPAAKGASPRKRAKVASARRKKR